MKRFVKKLDRVCIEAESRHGFSVIMRVGICVVVG